MRVQIVDPPAFTPPYDRALCAALAARRRRGRAGHEPVRVRPGAAAPRAIGSTELFYRALDRARARGAAAAAALRLAEHVPGMRRLRAHAAAADVVHLQWLSVPDLDRFLLPPRPRVFTVHYPLPASARALRAPARPALAHGRAHRPLRARRRRAARAGRPTRPASTGSRTAPSTTSPASPTSGRCPPELAAVEGPVILCFGLVRPYKGVDVLLEAFRELEGAELWIVGMPRMDLAPLRRAGRALPGHGPLRRPLHHRPRDPGALPPRRPRRAALPRGSSSRACSTRRSPSASRSSPARRRLHRGRRARRGAAAGPARATRRALAAALAELLGDPAARAALGRGGRAPPRPGPTRGTTIAARTLDALPRAGRRIIAPMAVARDRLLGRGRAARLHPPRLPAACSRCSPARRRRAPEPRAAPSSPRVSLIVAAHDEEEVIAAKVANALALDYPRERLELIVASDGSHRRTAELAREAGADLVLELAAGRQGPGPERRGRARLAASCSRSATRTRSGSPTRCASWSRRSPTRAVGYVCGQVRLLDQGGSQPGGRLLALRDGGPRARVAARRGHRRQRRDLRGPPRRLPAARPGRAATTSRSRSCSPSAAGAPSTRRRAVAEEKMVATIEGEFARKRRMMRGHLRRGRRRRDALAARLRAGLRVRDRQPPRAALRVAAPAPGRARREPGAARRRAGLRGHARGPARAAGRRGARRRDPARGRCGSPATTC